MKQLTQQQKNAIVETIAINNRKIAQQKLEEVMKNPLLNEKEQAYISKLKKYRTIADKIAELNQEKSQLYSEIVNSDLYTSGDANCGNSKKDSDIILKHVLQKRVISELEFNPEEVNIRRELEMLTITPDFDVKAFIDKFTIK